jgi:N-dimethylarginine dimethylaminohydrolase
MSSPRSAGGMAAYLHKSVNHFFSAQSSVVVYYVVSKKQQRNMIFYEDKGVLTPKMVLAHPRPDRENERCATTTRLRRAIILKLPRAGRVSTIFLL